jgi:hypothetical protein
VFVLHIETQVSADISHYLSLLDSGVIFPEAP